MWRRILRRVEVRLGSVVGSLGGTVTKRVWQFNLSSGGRPVPDAVRRETRAAILDHGQRYFDGRYRDLDVRYKAQFC